MTGPTNEQLIAAAESTLGEVAALRFGGVWDDRAFEPLVLPRIDSGPQFALEVLADARVRLDRVEELLANASRLRTLLAERSQIAEDEVSDAWAQAVTSGGGRRARTASFGEAAPRERYAEADVAVLAQRRSARAAALALVRVDAVRDTLRTAHWGVDKFRQDVHLVMRAMVVENSLER